MGIEKWLFLQYQSYLIKPSGFPCRRLVWGRHDSIKSSPLDRIPRAHARRFCILFACALCISFSAHAGRRITLPFHESLDVSSSVTDISWATQGGTVTWEPNGGWRGGGVKITSPHLNGNQGYAGLGTFDLIKHETRLNIRFLIYFGNSYQEQLQLNKLLIIHRDTLGLDLGSLRPMIMDNQRIQDGRERRFWRPCRGVAECAVVPEKAFTVSRSQNANQWVCFEFEADLVAERLSLYIHTTDGKYRGLSSSVSLAPERAEVATFNRGVSRPPIDFPIYQVQILGGFWSWSDGRRHGGVPGSQRNAEAYIRIDEIAMDRKYIGCPTEYGDKKK